MKRNSIQFVGLVIGMMLMTVSSCSQADGEWEEVVRVEETDTHTRAELIEYTVDVSTAGTLGNLIESYGYTDAQSLIVTGHINHDDVSYVDENLPSVEKLDLSGAEYYQSYIEGNFLCSSTCVKEISLPYNITEIVNGFIGENYHEGGYVLGAFYACSALEKVTIPTGVTSIEMYTFLNCASLTEVMLPEGLISMGDCCFQYCTSLTDITIPDGVTSIGYSCFDGCLALTEMLLPESVTSVGRDAFYGCKSLAKVAMPGVTSIGKEAFKDCHSLAQLQLPETLVSIGDYAFANCDEALTELTIPGSVRTIGEGAFWCCYSLTRITIMEGVTTIGEKAFSGCNPTELTVPSTVEDTGNSFIASGYSKLQKVTWNSSAYIGDLSMVNDLYCWLIINTKDGQVPVYGPNWKNVVIDGVAVNIELPYQYDKEFSIPQEVKSIQKIAYTMTFHGNHDIRAYGTWRTISLPFTPTHIIHPEKGELAPFDSEADVAHNFWLKELTEEGYKDVTTIEPNHPYIIAMPYSYQYGDEFNITGDVTFSAEDIPLGDAPELTPVSASGSEYTMYATYSYQEPTDGIYVLNEDSEFVDNYSDLYPFEAYVQPNTRSMRSVIPMTTGRVATRATSGEKRKPRKEDM